MKLATFTNEVGREIDWSAFIGQVVPVVSGHEQPITKDEMVVIVARKQREMNLWRAIKAMKSAGESDEARNLIRQTLG